MSEAADEVRRLIRERRLGWRTGGLSDLDRERLRQLCVRTQLCEYCGGPDGSHVSAKTAYADDPERPGVDMNPPLTLCPTCKFEYEDYWDEMWRQADSGRG